MTQPSSPNPPELLVTGIQSPHCLTCGVVFRLNPTDRLKTRGHLVPGRFAGSSASRKLCKAGVPKPLLGKYWTHRPSRLHVPQCAGCNQDQAMSTLRQWSARLASKSDPRAARVAELIARLLLLGVAPDRM